ncbi:MAG TPA: amidohydrolase family protein, partial [Chryseosolibacter sp.]|nr:amidohydrolase family protein [Chryseosolibacter sp.]
MCLIMAAGSCADREVPAELIVTGRIYTVNPAQPVVEAVAVSGDRIVFAGSSTGIQKYKGDKTRVIELGGRIMTPGFIDGHAHILGVGYNELNLNLSDVRNFDEIVERVRVAVAKAQPGEWIIGRGWHQDKWDRKPDRVIKGFQ